MLNWIINNWLSILGYGGYIVLGIFTVIGYFSKGRTDVEQEADAITKRLVEGLQATVNLQDRTIQKMQQDMEKHTEKRDLEVKDLRDKLHNLTGRNAVLEDLFKGRDPAMQSFLKDAPDLMRVAKENNDLGKSTAISVKTMADALCQLMGRLDGIKPAPQLEISKTPPHEDTIMG